MDEKCESCRRGFDGRNGNGYMPCSCKKKVVVLGVSRVNSLVRAVCHALANPPKKLK